VCKPASLENVHLNAFRLQNYMAHHLIRYNSKQTLNLHAHGISMIVLMSSFFFRPMSYYDTDVAIVCFSVSEPDSLENIHSKWVGELRNNMVKAPVILVGTKADLRNDDPCCLAQNTGQEAARRLGWAPPPPGLSPALTTPCIPQTCCFTLHTIHVPLF